MVARLIVDDLDCGSRRQGAGNHLIARGQRNTRDLTHRKSAACLTDWGRWRRYRNRAVGASPEVPSASSAESRRIAPLSWLPLENVGRSVLEQLAQFQFVEALEEALEAREFGWLETVRIDGDEHDRPPRHHIFIHVLNEEEVFVESNAVHDRLDAVQEDDAAVRMVVDERLDDLREEADGGP